ncbi:MAG TPA: glycosyltransferase family 4 protein [Gemmatimonadales bacterium]|nr:glycosyltransferase family 4 protein [Gemmatimonadales bacterium]
MTNPARPVIGYVVGSYPELTQTFVLREAAALRARGFDVIIFAVKRAPLPGVERSVGQPGETVVYARPDWFWRHIWANVWALLRHPRRYLAALRPFRAGVWERPPRTSLQTLYHFHCGIGFVGMMRARGVSHLHCHFTTGSNIALAVNLYAGIPFSFSAHASGDIYMQPTLLDLKLARAWFAVPVCEYNRRYLNAVTAHRHAGKLRTIYNGIDLAEGERWLPAGNRPGNATGEASELRIVSIGSLVVMKGHGTLVEACRLLRERGHRVRCDIIGAGPEQATLASLITETGMADAVRLRGPLPLRDVYAALGEADVFALLSEIGVDGYRDGFPTVILEAMSAGLPVVSTWISGTPEMVLHEETGLLLHERDAAAAADAFERLLEDETLRWRMGSAGRRRVEERFQLDQSAARLAALFDAVVTGQDLPALPAIEARFASDNDARSLVRG